MTRQLSCRRACALVGVARSALGYVARRPGRDAALVAELSRERDFRRDSSVAYSSVA